MFARGRALERACLTVAASEEDKQRTANVVLAEFVFVRLPGGGLNIMRVALRSAALGVIACLPLILSATADDQKSKIKDGIDGYVLKVDAEGKKLTITTQGRERTFTITDATEMVGPNGGKVRKHLKDPRFHEGFHVIIVANGSAAEEVHLGFAKDARDEAASRANAVSQRESAERATKASERTRVANAPAADTEAATERRKVATKMEEEDDEQEIPGHIKSFNVTRRLLVVSLLNGKNRTFLLPHDVPVHIKGSGTASSLGLKDPSLAEGAFVTVVTDEGGRKVKELKVVKASEARRRRAG
jgi:hypothetical protein